MKPFFFNHYPRPCFSVVGHAEDAAGGQETPKRLLACGPQAGLGWQGFEGAAFGRDSQIVAPAQGTPGGGKLGGRPFAADLTRPVLYNLLTQGNAPTHESEPPDNSGPGQCDSGLQLTLSLLHEGAAASFSVRGMDPHSPVPPLTCPLIHIPPVSKKQWASLVSFTGQTTTPKMGTLFLQ